MDTKVNYLDYKLNKINKFNETKSPIWKRLKIIDFNFPKYTDYKRKYIDENNFNSIDLYINYTDRALMEDIELVKYINLNDKFGLEEKFTSYVEAYTNSGITIVTKENKKINETVLLDFNINQENNVLVDHNLIIAKPYSELNVVIDYYNDKNIAGYHNGVTKVYAQEGSMVNIIKVQRLSKECEHYDSNVAIVENNANVNWIDIQVGSNTTGVSYSTYLKGYKSKSDLKSIYLGYEDTKQDLNYTINFIGKKSEGNIESKGALKDTSSKVFRGTLNFTKGSSGSKGSEKEYVILLDKTVKADAIPALMCSEDDVVGEHAASAGQIDFNQLFYLMSRGLSEKEAKKLIIESSFRPIVDNIPIENIKESILEKITYILEGEKYETV
jgi:FeS assembly protein SufD